MRDLPQTHPEVYIEFINGTQNNESKKQTREVIMTSQKSRALGLVETMTEKIYEKFVNPFRSINKTDLLNIVTGEKEISTDLVNAKGKGIQEMKKAKENGGDAIESPELVTYMHRR